MGTICPYCNIEVDEASIEFEDGCCPECGSVITASSMHGDKNEAVMFEEDDDYLDDLDYDLEEEDEKYEKYGDDEDEEYY